MAGLDIDDLRALVLKRLRVTDTTRYSPTGGTADYDWIDDALNRGQRIFARETRCIRTPVIIQPASGYRSYRMPEGCMDIMSAWYYDSSFEHGYKELGVTTIERLNDEYSDWRTDQGTPTHVYMDRVYGNEWTIGIYPIPDADGDTVSFDSTYGSEVAWVCPNYTYNQDYLTVLRPTSSTTYFLNTSQVVGEVESMNHCLWIEMFRLPGDIKEGTTTASSGVNYPEIPKEYHESLVDFAASDLLENNPEDSAEFKRSQMLKNAFNNEMSSYIKRRKKPLSAQDVRGKAMSWGWLNSMNFYSSQF